MLKQKPFFHVHHCHVYRIGLLEAPEIQAMVDCCLHRTIKRRMSERKPERLEVAVEDKKCSTEELLTGCYDYAECDTLTFGWAGVQCSAAGNPSRPTVIGLAAVQRCHQSTLESTAAAMPSSEAAKHVHKSNSLPISIGCG